MPITHPFVSAQSQSSDPSVVSKNEWNAEHSLTGTGGIPSGSGSFPGSPTSGDLYWRSDRKILYVYDGTRWLCTCPHIMHIRSWQNVSAADTLTYAFAIPGAQDNGGIWMERLVASMYQTNGTPASNYVTVTLRKYEAGVNSDIASVSSQNNAASEFIIETVSIAAALATTADALAIHLAETGAATGVYVGASLEYRLIG